MMIRVVMWLACVASLLLGAFIAFVAAEAFVKVAFHCPAIRRDNAKSVIAIGSVLSGVSFCFAGLYAMWLWRRGRK